MVVVTLFVEFFMGYLMMKTAFDLVQKQESNEFFPEIGSVKTLSYRNPVYDHFYEKRIAL